MKRRTQVWRFDDRSELDDLYEIYPNFAFITVTRPYTLNLYYIELGAAL